MAERAMHDICIALRRAAEVHRLYFLIESL